MLEGYATIWLVSGGEGQTGVGRSFSLRGRWRRYWCYLSHYGNSLSFCKEPTTVNHPINPCSFLLVLRFYSRPNRKINKKDVFHFKE